MQYSAMNMQNTNLDSAVSNSSMSCIGLVVIGSLKSGFFLQSVSIQSVDTYQDATSTNSVKEVSHPLFVNSGSKCRSRLRDREGTSDTDRGRSDMEHVLKVGDGSSEYTMSDLSSQNLKQTRYCKPVTVLERSEYLVRPHITSSVVVPTQGNRQDPQRCRTVPSCRIAAVCMCA